MTILVTGARGNIGSRVIAKLAEAGHRVRGSARDPQLLRLPPGVTTIALDITNPQNAEAALQDVDTIFLYPTRGGTDNFLKAARAANVQHIVLLSSPAAYEAGEYEHPIGLAHRAVEQALENSGLRYTILYPSWLATNTLRDWGEQVRSQRQVGLTYPDAQVSPIHIDDIAEVAADLLTSEHHRSRMHILTGPESLRLRDVVAVLSDVLGQPITINKISREQALEQRPSWMPAATLTVLLDVMARAIDVPAALTNTVERITGHPAHPFREWVYTHRTEFEPK